MAGKRKTPLWRQPFIRALERSGNVRAAAFEAGVDPGTAYAHRWKDKGFAARWEKAAAKAKSGPVARKAAAGRSGGQLVLRRTRHGDQLIRAGAGRWNKRAEDLFLAALKRTGCVRAAASACGFSTTALYERRDKYPEFAARWDEAVAQSRLLLPDLLNAASIASFDSEVEARDLPPVNVDQAIRIAQVQARAGAARAGRAQPRRASRAELTEAILRLLDIAEKRQRQTRLAEGWIETGEGLLIPPGPASAGPAGDDGARPKEAG